MSYRPARLHRLQELIPCSILGLLKSLKIRALQCWNFLTIYGGKEPSRNRVVVPAQQATQAAGIDSLGFLKVKKFGLQVGRYDNHIPTRLKHRGNTKRIHEPKM